MNRLAVIFFLAGALLVTAFARMDPAAGAGSTTKKTWGNTRDGQSANLYVLKSAGGTEVAISTFGGAVVSLKMPDREGKMADVVLGYDSVEGYEDDTAHLGAIIGRYGNRIAHAQFSLDGKTYTLAKNNGDNSLHGGLQGFDKKVWAAKEIPANDGQALELSYLSKDGEEGFPGNLKVTVTYTFTGNALHIAYDAKTDKKTVVNLTNHSYFNLSGAGSGNVLDTILTIYSDKFLPVDAGMIPTGELRDVTGTPFDFRVPATIGARINQDDEQLKLGNGYDHNYVLRPPERGATETLAARAMDVLSGRVMEVWTAEPGMQLYTANFLDVAKGKGGMTYRRRTAFCLETQHFPDSPNHPAFPSTVLNPGELYHTTTTYRFSVAN